jgi:hypothetical protein
MMSNPDELRSGSAPDAGGLGGAPPPELDGTGAAGLLDCSGAEFWLADGVGVGEPVGVGEAVGVGAIGTIVPRLTATVAELAASVGPKFKARSDTEFAFNVSRLLTPSEHRDTCTVYRLTVPLTALTSQFTPLIVKSFAARPVTASENNNPKSKFKALVGEVGEVNVTVGGVLSITTSEVTESAVGPATIPESELASRVNRKVPTPQSDAVTT